MPIESTDLEKRRCRCDALMLVIEAQNLKEHRGSGVDGHLKRDAQDQGHFFGRRDGVS